MNVLIIDDNFTRIQYAQSFFHENGNTTTIAGCCETALELIDQQHFDVIVTDIMRNKYIPKIYMTYLKGELH